MTTNLTTQAVESAARALLDDRIEAVRALAIARQAVAEKRGELDAVERADAAAYAAAQRAGWSTEELRKVGLDEPARKAPGRPRRAPRSPRPSPESGNDTDPTN